jgi:hypothetical protein
MIRAQRIAHFDMVSKTTNSLGCVLVRKSNVYRFSLSSHNLAIQKYSTSSIAIPNTITDKLKKKKKKHSVHYKM